MSVLARKYITDIKSQPCALCALLGQPQESVTDAHHIRDGQGGAQRASDWLTVPLCHSCCHQGQNGIHGDRSLFRIAKVGELDLIALQIERLFRRSA